jgi:hypothetical protein
MSTHGTEIVNSLQKRVLQMEKGQLVRDSKKGQYDEPHASDVIKEPIKVGKTKKTSDIKAKIVSESLDNEEQFELPKDTKDSVVKVAAEAEDTNETKITEEKAATEEIKTEKKQKPKAKTQLDVDADSELTTLKISAEIIEVLEKNGYRKVEDILKDGMAKVNKHLSQKQVRSLARAIKKFVTSE